MTKIDTSSVAIEALLKDVTPGPWYVEKRYSFVIHKETPQVMWDVPNATARSLIADTGNNVLSGRSDASFIAAARELVPALLAERDALEEEVERLKAQVVTVKQLEWGVGDEPGEWSAGPYDVWREFDRFKLYYWRIVIGDPHETVEAAKAAAQDHHKARILSAITTRSEDEVWNEALDKACNAIVKEARETLNGVDEYSADMCADTVRAIKRPVKEESHE